MTIEEDIAEFRVWATKLGCPQASIPHEDALKVMFRCPQNNLFRNLMRRVKAQQDVKEIRDNILIAKMESIRDQVIPIAQRSYLPKQIQTHLKIQDLKKSKAQLSERCADVQRKFETLAATIKTKNIQCIRLQQKAELAEHRMILLDMKSESLQQNILKEEENKHRIVASMPAKLSEKNASDASATDAVERGLRELEVFYQFYTSHSGNRKLLAEAKDQLWAKLRDIFKDVPNLLLFNAVMRLKDEQLNTIMALNQESPRRGGANSFVGGGARDEPLSPFEERLARGQADALALVAKYLGAREERVALESRFTANYLRFVDELETRVKQRNAGDNEEHAEEAISDYVVQYNMRNFSKSRNDYLAEQIDQLKADIGQDAKQLENHEVLLGSIRQVYEDINQSINGVHHEIVQLRQIKEKILYSKNMMKLQLDDLQACLSSKAQLVSLKAAQPQLSPISGGGGLGAPMGDSFLCSTKLDFDTTAMNSSVRRSLNATDMALKREAGGSGERVAVTTPPHSLELNLFAETPLEKFACMPRECAFHLLRNPLIVESSELSSTIQLAPGTLRTASGCLLEVRNRISWANLIAQHSAELKSDLPLVFVNAKALQAASKRQHEHVIELLDKIDVTAINTERTLHKLSRLYDFILENPLRWHVPSTKLFNNQTYAAYESEYAMYYRMATVGGSIK